MEPETSRAESIVEPELYFLIAKFLSVGPCRESARVLRGELERAEILPNRLDWLGNSHSQSFEEVEKKLSHIGPRHLLKICSRIGPLLDKEVPPCVPGVASLLGIGKQSLLRTKTDSAREKPPVTSYTGRFGGRSFLDPPNHAGVHNLVRVLQGRENSGPLHRRQAIQTSFYNRIQMYRHTLGHLSAVYCVLYDRTGKYIITGADDLLVKVWSSTNGRLLATFRGAAAEIMDIAVNFDNTLLAAGSLDRIVRVWCFQTMSPVAVLSGHSGMITSVNFCPIPCNYVNYLVTTSSDGSVAFWSHTKRHNERVFFESKPIQYHEKMRPGQAQMICASFSPGGAFMAAGSADHHVRVYAMLGDEGPRRVLETEAHSDTVDSIQWAHSGLKFISGSKDGTAHVWRFKEQEWVSKCLLMTTKLPGDTKPDDEGNKKFKVTMVAWDVSDTWVVTAVNDSSLRVWNAESGDLVRVLRAHRDEVFVLESHPIDPRIILSAGHDGQLIIWDVLNPEPIACFQNFIEGQGNGAVFDAKWSPDGTMLAATDSHGHLLMYGFGSRINRHKTIPKELFFHTDYRPLMRDANNYVLDEQTQTAPHLMPPPFLVDVDGNPYTPALQQLVPGREHCLGEQLVPNIAVGASGMQEVIEGLPEQGPVRSNIDRLIEDLAQRQNLRRNEEEERAQNQGDFPIRQLASPRGSRTAGLRRAGNVEGVRQSSGNWQRDSTTPWNKPILGRPLSFGTLETQCKQFNAMAEMELECWRREMRRRPQAALNAASSANGTNNRTRTRNNRTARHGYRTRATREDEEDDFDNDHVSSVSSASNSSDDSSVEEEICSDSSSSDPSSAYSDWMADHGLHLQPPKRSKRKPVKKRSPTPPSDPERRRSQRPKKKLMPVANGVDEVPALYRPSEWLTEVIPRKAPYYPQMGDEVVYFRQGHQFYLNAVKNKKIYELGPKCEPWSKIKLRAQEFVKVVGIKYEIRPPRLCCLKLALMNEDGGLTRNTFTIKYHDMADVLDFLVLRQTFDAALARSWSENDRFRCVIDDGWWIGQIQSMEPLDEAFPESYFMCFRVRWDNGEFERMSPWDLELVDESRLPVKIGGAVPVLPEEIQDMLYKPQPEEWPLGDREGTCRRIIRGLDQVMSLAIAEHFVAPVDLNIYPSYAITVEYPIDLSTIKARFENRFYRRVTSAQFDVRYLATNAEQFNESHSHIVKHARIVTDLCLQIMKENKDVDVSAVYHRLADSYRSSDSEDEDVDDARNRPSTSRQRSTPRKKVVQEVDWKLACRRLLDTLWMCEDSIPFREPVDRLEHPDYHQLIDTPMDLRTVKEDLFGGNYETPIEFAKDMRLIFMNSRNYNTNKRSRIYSMTIRLSAMFEEHIKMIISSWKSSERAKRRSEHANKKKAMTTRLTNGAGPSKVKYASDDDEEEEEEEDEREAPKRPVRNADGAGPSRITNGHSKTPRKTKKNTDSEHSNSSDSDASQASESSVGGRALPQDSDSEDSYNPSGRGKQPNRRKPQNNKMNLRKKGKTKMSSEEEMENEEQAAETPDSSSSSSSSSPSRDEESEEEAAEANSKRSSRVYNSTEEVNNGVDVEENDNNVESSDDTSQPRTTRSQITARKRPRYIEESDDSAPTRSRRKMRADSEDEDETPVLPSRTAKNNDTDDSESGDNIPLRRSGLRTQRDCNENNNVASSRNRRAVRRPYYAEDPEESEEETSGGPHISISSRGRVRRMTERARASRLFE